MMQEHSQSRAGNNRPGRESKALLDAVEDCQIEFGSDQWPPETLAILSEMDEYCVLADVDV